jgi:hypothetical protein
MTWAIFATIAMNVGDIHATRNGVVWMLALEARLVAGLNIKGMSDPSQMLGMMHITHDKTARRISIDQLK